MRLARLAGQSSLPPTKGRRGAGRRAVGAVSWSVIAPPTRGRRGAERRAVGAVSWPVIASTNTGSAGALGGEEAGENAMHHSDGKRAKRQPSLVERLPRNAAIVVIFSTGLFLLVSYAKQARVQQQVMRKSEIRISKSERNEDENQNPKSEKTPSAAAQPSRPIGKSEIRNPKSETNEDENQNPKSEKTPSAAAQPSPPIGKSEIRNPKQVKTKSKAKTARNCRTPRLLCKTQSGTKSPHPQPGLMKRLSRYGQLCCAREFLVGGDAFGG